MNKEYLVTAYEIIRTVYIVPAGSPEEAKKRVEDGEQSFSIAQEEYHDRQSIDDEVEVNE